MRTTHLARTAHVVHVAACCALALPATLPAQELSIEAPPNLILPNYERVPIGQREGIEGGAYVARTDDGAGNWFNPAGLARARVSAINASAAAYEWTSLELEGLGTATGRSRFSSIGTLFSAVLADPVITSDRWRLGVSLTKPVSWRPSRIDAVFPGPAFGDDARIGYSANVELSQYVPAVNVGWAPAGPDGRLRLGVGLAASYTSMTQDQTLSLRAVTDVAAALVERRYASEGSVTHALLNAGVQFDVTPRVTLGARFVSPGLRMFGTSAVSYAATATTSSDLADLTLMDKEARFEYKLPLQLDAGIAVRLDRGAAEVDVRYHGKVSPYELFGSDATGRLVRSPAGAPPTSSAIPFTPTMHEARAVTNVAVGANYSLTRVMRAHVGFSTDQSPVASESGSVFRRVDLWHGTGGLSFTGRRLSGSIGLAYSSGDGKRVDAVGIVSEEPLSTQLRVRSLSLLYALSVGF